MQPRRIWFAMQVNALDLSSGYWLGKLAPYGKKWCFYEALRLRERKINKSNFKDFLLEVSNYEGSSFKYI